MGTLRLDHHYTDEGRTSEAPKEDLGNALDRMNALETVVLRCMDETVGKVSGFTQSLVEDATVRRECTKTDARVDSARKKLLATREALEEALEILTTKLELKEKKREPKDTVKSVLDLHYTDEGRTSEAPKKDLENAVDRMNALKTVVLRGMEETVGKVSGFAQRLEDAAASRPQCSKTDVRVDSARKKVLATREALEESLDILTKLDLPVTGLETSTSRSAPEPCPTAAEERSNQEEQFQPPDLERFPELQRWALQLQMDYSKWEKHCEGIQVEQECYKEQLIKCLTDLRNLLYTGDVVMTRPAGKQDNAWFNDFTVTDTTAERPGQNEPGGYRLQKIVSFDDMNTPIEVGAYVELTSQTEGSCTIEALSPHTAEDKEEAGDVVMSPHTAEDKDTDKVTTLQKIKDNTASYPAEDYSENMTFEDDQIVILWQEHFKTLAGKDVPPVQYPSAEEEESRGLREYSDKEVLSMEDESVSDSPHFLTRTDPVAHVEEQIWLAVADQIKTFFQPFCKQRKCVDNTALKTIQSLCLMDFESAFNELTESKLELGQVGRLRKDLAQYQAKALWEQLRLPHPRAVCKARVVQSLQSCLFLLSKLRREQAGIFSDTREVRSRGSSQRATSSKPAESVFTDRSLDFECLESEEVVNVESSENDVVTLF